MNHVRHMRLRKALLGGAVLVVLSSAAALALASQRIAAEQSAYSAPSAGRCTPATLNRSAVLPGTSLAVSPLPGSYAASPATQISLLGAPVSALSKISVKGSQTGSHAGHLRAYSQGDGGSFVLEKPLSPGETVTVRGRLAAGSKTEPFAFSFVVAHEDVSLAGAKASAAGSTPRDPDEWQHFHSSPELEAPVIDVTARSSQSAPGDLFAAPYVGPGPSGPMIFEESGNLVWFHRLPANVSRDQPAGAAGRRPAGVDLVAGLHPAAGIRPGRRDHRQHLLPPDRPRARRQRLPGRPARIPDHATGDGAADGVQPDRLQPVLGGRAQRRGGDQQHLPGNRPCHGAGASRMGEPRPHPAGGLLQHGDRFEPGVAVRLLPHELDRPAGKRQDADLGAQHLNAL